MLPRLPLFNRQPSRGRARAEHRNTRNDAGAAVSGPFMGVFQDPKRSTVPRGDFAATIAVRVRLGGLGCGERCNANIVCIAARLGLLFIFPAPEWRRAKRVSSQPSVPRDCFSQSHRYSRGYELTPRLFAEARGCSVAMRHVAAMLQAIRYCTRALHMLHAPAVTCYMLVRLLPCAGSLGV